MARRSRGDRPIVRPRKARLHPRAARPEAAPSPRSRGDRQCDLTHEALGPCGRTMDETVGIFAALNSVRQLALGGEVARNVLALDSLIKCKSPSPKAGALRRLGRTWRVDADSLTNELSWRKGCREKSLFGQNQGLPLGVPAALALSPETSRGTSLIAICEVARNHCVLRPLPL